jgi:thiamine pyrophosphate-dependent acetolactate synthase large subunit-like protein
MTERVRNTAEVRSVVLPAVPTTAGVVAWVTSRFTIETFGVMGNGNALFIDALADEGVGYRALRHEAGAVAAADAYARVTGHVGVATTTFGAGFANTLTALADAVRAKSPVVIVTGDAPTSGPRHADVDIPALAVGVGATSWTLEPGREVEVARLAFESALRDSRPAVIAIPYDLAGNVVERFPEPRSTRKDDSTAGGVIPPSIAEVIFGAERLLVLTGRGAVLSGAEELATKFVQRRSAASATTALAHGMFHGQRGALGVAGGFSSDSAARTMRSADVVLVLGAGLDQHTTRNGTLFAPDAQVIQVDLAVAATSAVVSHHVRMDVSGFLRLLMNQRGGGPPVPDSWAPAEAAAVKPSGSAAGLHPQVVSEAIASLLPNGVATVLDGGNFMAWPLEAWLVRSSDAFVPAGLAFQSIGLGLPAMIGAAFARPDRLPVLAVGDGGMLMSLADLESASRLIDHGLIVVYNDSAYGAELHQYERLGLRTGPMRFPTTDFAALADAVGMHSAVVRSIAGLSALERWLDSGAPGIMLLDCRIASDVPAPFLRKSY